MARIFSFLKLGYGVVLDIINFMISAFIFILGTIIGSFLNVLVLRYGNLFYSKQRSGCFSCSHTLNFFDLIPILSFLYLGGKCQYCKSKISVQYPLVEFLTGLVFFFTYMKIGIIGIELLFWLTIWSIFIAIFVYDLKHKIIPNGLVYTLILLSFVYTLWPVYFGSGVDLWLIAAGPIAATPFAFLWLVSRGRWMGLGDAKLALAMGWLLGVLGVISAITYAFWLGAVVGLFLIFLSRIKLSVLSQKFKNLTIKSEIPFAPFLIIGTGVVFFIGITILELSVF